MQDIIANFTKGSLAGAKGTGASAVDATKLLSGVATPDATAMQQNALKLVKNLIITLKVEGRGNFEIAQQVGWTPKQVDDLLMEEWAKTRLIRELLAKGKDPALSLVQSSAVDNILTMMQLRDDPKASPAVRLAAAKELTEREYGKARQAESSKDKDKSLPTTVEEIDRQLVSLREQQKNTISRSE